MTRIITMLLNFLVPWALGFQFLMLCFALLVIWTYYIMILTLGNALFNRMNSLFSKNLNHQEVSNRSNSALGIFFKSSMQAFLLLVSKRQGSMVFDYIWSASSDVSSFVNKLNQYLMLLYREINYILTLYYRIE